LGCHTYTRNPIGGKPKSIKAPPFIFKKIKDKPGFIHNKLKEKKNEKR